MTTEPTNPDSSDDLEQLMDDYAPSLLRYAARLVRNVDSAQDLVQQAFVRYAGLNDDRLPKTHARKSWLYRVTHNLAVDLIRKEQRRNVLHEDHAERLEEAQEHQNTREKQLRTALHFADQLEGKQKQVLLLRLQEGLSYKEIAEVTGFKEGHVGYLLHEAVRNLSTLIHEEDPS